LRSLKQGCNSIVSKCEESGLDAAQFKTAIETEILGSRLHHDELQLLFNTVRDLDFANPKSFTLLFSFKVDEINKKFAWVKEIAAEYNKLKHDRQTISDMEKMCRNIAAKRASDYRAQKKNLQRELDNCQNIIPS